MGSALGQVTLAMMEMWLEKGGVLKHQVSGACNQAPPPQWLDKLLFHSAGGQVQDQGLARPTAPGGEAEAVLAGSKPCGPQGCWLAGAFLLCLRSVLLCTYLCSHFILLVVPVMMD